MCRHLVGVAISALLTEAVDDGIIQSEPAPGEIGKRGRRQNAVQDIRTAYFFIHAVRVES